MKTVLNKDKLNNLTNEIWKSAERLRGKFKAYEYQSVILPIIVIRRLECVLISWREKQAADILKKRPDIKEEALATLVKKLELNPKKSPFSNKTNWTLAAICKEDPTLMEKNFRDYIKGFSENIQDIINHFDYRAVISRMVNNARLAPILRQYANEKLGPDHLSNLEMGYIYEELLRRFSEQSGEEAGEHFTPREVIRLMVELLDIPLPHKHLSIYDPACGTGGMLSIAKEHLLDKAVTDKEKKDVERLVTVHGHELQPGNYAICQSDMLIKDDKQAEICYGNSLIPHSEQSREPGDQLAGAQHKFDFMLSNPPFGVTWGGKDGYEKEARKYQSSRYQAGMPRTNDGALLFLQTMLAKMKPVSRDGSRIAIIFNGSAGLSPFTPEQAALKAGRLMLKEIRGYAGRRESFAFETTLSGRLYTRYIRQWQETGYRIKLIFLSLPDVEIAVERVRIRVAQGGHNVDEPVIRRRFDKGWNNFHNIYKNLVDA